MTIIDRIRRLLPSKAGQLRLTLPTAALPLFVLACAFTVIGLGLVFQTSRFEATPSYGNLLEIAPAMTWGFLHLLTAATMFASIRYRTMRLVAVIAHTLGIILTGSWLLAFVVRYLTDDGTTVVNVVSWIVFFYLAVRSATELDQWTEPRPSAGAAK